MADKLYTPDVAPFEKMLFEIAGQAQLPFLLIDGEWCLEAYSQLENSDLLWDTLWQGALAVERKQSAPYLVLLEPKHPFTRWFIENYWGRGCGVWIVAAQAEESEDLLFASLTQLKRHLRHFTAVELEENGEIVDFRFYDPAVLATYVQSCSSSELKAFFGPISCFIVEHYNEVSSLNCSHQFYYFAQEVQKGASLEQDNAPSQLSIDMYDMPKKRRLFSETVEPHPEREGRKKVAHVMISKEQMTCFEEKEKLKIVEEIAQNLCNYTKKDISYLRNLSCKHVGRGVSYGLFVTSQLLEFMRCVILYGDNFPENHREACFILEENMRSPHPYEELAIKFQEWCGIAIGEET